MCRGITNGVFITMSVLLAKASDEQFIGHHMAPRTNLSTTESRRLKLYIAKPSLQVTDTKSSPSLPPNHDRQFPSNCSPPLEPGIAMPNITAICKPTHFPNPPIQHHPYHKTHHQPSPPQAIATSTTPPVQNTFADHGGIGGEAANAAFGVALALAFKLVLGLDLPGYS
jgi:hypothetical protein